MFFFCNGRNHKNYFTYCLFIPTNGCNKKFVTPIYFCLFYFLKQKQQVASGAADTETAQMKKVSLVSSDVLNSYNRAKTDALAAQPVSASSSSSSAAAAAASKPDQNVKHFDMVLKLLHCTALN